MASEFKMVVGVFAGTARGAKIGAGLGTMACFLFLAVYSVIDAIDRGISLTSPAEVGAVLLFGAVWMGFVSVVLGGPIGAAVGAMIGTFFPVRRAPSVARSQSTEATCPPPPT